MDKPSGMLGRLWTTPSRSLTKSVSQLSDGGPVKAAHCCLLHHEMGWEAETKTWPSLVIPGRLPFPA